MRSETVKGTAPVPTKKTDVKMLAVTGMLSAVAFILMYLEVSVPVMPFFIKLDLSDLPALIAACCFGPVSGVFVCLVKNLIHLLFTNTVGVGELANFLMGALFVIPAGLICKKSRTRKSVFLGAVLGAVLSGIGSVVVNYLIVYPVYYKLFMPEEVVLDAYKKILPSVNSIIECLLIFNLPFTAFKGMLSALLMLPFYRVLLSVFGRKGT